MMNAEGISPELQVGAQLACLLGILYVALGLLINPFTLDFVLERDLTFGSPVFLYILALDLVAVLLGVSAILFRRRPAVQKVQLTVTILLVFFGASEWAARMIDRPDRLRTADPYLHHTLLPNAEDVSYWGNRLVTYQTNSLGYRDRDKRQVAAETPAAVRIVFLGDSFTEGMGVAYEETYVARTGDLLKRNVVDVEVLNAGVASYSPRLSYRRLTRFFEQGYSTDQVVMALDMSDIVNEGRDYRGWEAFTPQQVDSIRLEKLDPLRSRLIGLAGRAVQVLQAKLNDAPPDFRLAADNALYTRETPAWERAGLDLCKAYILKTKILSDEQGAAFSLFIYPHPQQVGHPEESRGYRDEITLFAEEHGIPLYDLFPYFDTLEEPERYFIPGDIHWNERGHGLVAETLFPWLKAQIGTAVPADSLERTDLPSRPSHLASES